MTTTINASTSAGLIQTADTSGVLALQTAGTTAVTIDASQNAGLGVTPSAWNSAAKALQYSTSGSLWAVGGQSRIGNNHYYDAAGTFRYLLSGAIASDFSQTSGGFSWSIAPSGTAGNAVTFTTSMVLDSSGRLGVGTTTPVGKLTVVGGNSNNLIVDNDGSQYTQLLLARNGTANTGGDLLIDGTNATMSLRMLAVGALRFCTSTSIGDGTERARITSSGDLLVGLTTVAAGSSNTIYKNSDSTWVFRVEAGATSLPNGILVKYSGTSPNSTGSQFLYCEDSGNTQRMSVRSNGGIANYSGNDVNLSDRREKINFAPAGSYLDKICAIPVQTFNYIDQNLEEDDGLTLGVVAQDVQAVAPELVMESNWAGKDEEPKMRLSIYQTDLQYALMKCIQEQQALITQLQADVAALKAAQ